MTKRLFCFIALSLLALPGRADDGIYFMADADSYAAPIAIKAFITGWHGSLHGGDTAFADADVESGLRLGSNSVGYVWRYDYLLDFSPQTAAIYYEYKNRLTPMPQQLQSLSIDVNHVETRGMQFAHEFQLREAGDWRLRAAVNLLKGTQLTVGTLDGAAQFSGPDFKPDSIASLEADIDYRYSHPALHEQDLDWFPPAPEGDGYGLDVDLKGDFSARTHASLSVRNALGYVYWKDVPATRYDLSCQCSVSEYDATGQLQIDRRYRQTLPRQEHASLHYDLSPHWYAAGDILGNPLVTFASAGLGHQQGGGHEELRLEPQTRSLIVEAGYKTCGLRWQADRVDPAEARRFGLSLYGELAW